MRRNSFALNFSNFTQLIVLFYFTIMGGGQSKQDNVVVAQAQVINSNKNMETKIEYLSLIILITVILLGISILCVLRRYCVKSTKSWLRKQVTSIGNLEQPVIRVQSTAHQPAQQQTY